MLIKLFAKPGLNSVVTEWGAFVPEGEDRSVQAPERAVDTLITHGFSRQPYASPAPAPVQDLGTKPKDLEPFRPTRTAADWVASAIRPDLKEYCEANEIEIPPRTPDAKLRELVLAHMTQAPKPAE